MDDIDRKILKLLQDNARISLKTMAENTFLSSPAVSARIEKLEKDGVIELMPVAVYPKKYLDELRSEINEAKAKIAAGEQPVFDTVDALFEALDGADE